jgi:hypothetical protein
MTTKNSSNPPRDGLSRRKFIFLSSMVAGSVMARAVPRTLSANDKLNIGIIGYGGQGNGDAGSCSTENIIALCDVDEKINPQLRARFPDAKYYQDFRKMFDSEKTLDAVNIATPDHSHAFIAATAMKLGINVYVQKPLAHSVFEARLLRKLAAETKVATQMGNQGSAAKGLRRGVEVIQSGIIGQVHDVYVWSNRPIWPQGLPMPEGEDPIPEGLDWDLWLGPAPLRKFKANRTYHTFNWRGWVDFGTGALGDMACHTCNLPFRALKLGYPSEIEAETLNFTKACYPSKSSIRFQFPAREGLDPVTFRWYDGGNPRPGGSHDGNNKPPADVTAGLAAMGREGREIPASGCLMVGTKGLIFSPDDYGTEFYLKLNDETEYSPGASHQGVAAIPQSIPRNTFQGEAHHQEWIAACKGGKPGFSNFDIAAYLTEIMLLGCVAIRAGKKLEWDGPNMTAKNAPEASQFVHPEFRKGWEMPS